MKIHLHDFPFFSERRQCLDSSSFSLRFYHVIGWSGSTNANLSALIDRKFQLKVHSELIQIPFHDFMPLPSHTKIEKAKLCRQVLLQSAHNTYTNLYFTKLNLNMPLSSLFRISIENYSKL